MYPIFSIYSPIGGHPGWFYILAIENKCSGKHGSLRSSCCNPVFISFGGIPTKRIAGWYDKSLFNFLRKYDIVFHSDWTNLHSHQKWMRVPFLPHALHHLLSFVFLTTVLPTSVNWYFTVVSICISLVIHDVEHLFTCLLAILMYMVHRMGKNLCKLWMG